MGKRRTSRILAMSILYQQEIRPAETLEDIIHGTLMLEDYDVEVVRFAETLVRGVSAARDEIDALIAEHADNWTLSRMASIDRNVMRISIFEMQRMSDIPRNVSINEAVEIAKTYSTDKSGEFVNGVLDKVGRLLQPAGENPPENRE